jgi:hypothetical protein
MKNDARRDRQMVYQGEQTTFISRDDTGDVSCVSACVRVFIFGWTVFFARAVIFFVGFPALISLNGVRDMCESKEANSSTGDTCRDARDIFFDFGMSLL